MVKDDSVKTLSDFEIMSVQGASERWVPGLSVTECDAESLCQEIYYPCYYEHTADVVPSQFCAVDYWVMAITALGFGLLAIGL